MTHVKRVFSNSTKEDKIFQNTPLQNLFSADIIDISANFNITKESEVEGNSGERVKKIAEFIKTMPELKDKAAIGEILSGVSHEGEAVSYADIAISGGGGDMILRIIAIPDRVI